MKSLLFILLMAVPGFSQIEGNPKNWCREGFFTRDSKDFTLAYAKPAAASRAYFYGDSSDKCPLDPSCRRKAYLVRGNEVVVNRVLGNFACAWFSPVKGAPTIGWLRLSDLDHPNTILDASEIAWVGDWKFAENSIKITPNKLAGFLNVTGDAVWRGVGDNVHLGELDGRFEHKNGLINYSDGDGEFDCKARLNLLGRFLIVSDNFNCGGAGVSFSGIYVRKKR